MLILDTDHVSLAFWGRGVDAERVRARVASADIEQLRTSIISYEEQTRGWLVFAAKAKTVAQQVHAYQRLERHLENYKKIPLVGFSEAAAMEYQRLRKEGIRIGAMDLRIAAIALTNDATVVTRNVAHFQKVPGLKLEDWSKP